MLHHISLGVADLERAAAFYDAVLGALGYVRVWTDATAIGYGQNAGKDRLSIKLRGAEAGPPGAGFHLALAAPSRAAVSNFHAAALEQPLIDRFTTMYRHHIDAEERVLLPALKKTLGKADWQAVGRAMAERRGLEWDDIAKPVTPKGRRP